VKAHPVEFPAEPPLQFGKLGSGGLVFLQHLLQDSEHFVGIGHIPLIEGEMVFQQRLAETRHSDKL
jgi:hypothetical protein